MYYTVSVRTSVNRELIESLQEAGRRYSGATQGLRPEQRKLGPPCIMLAEACVFHFTTLTEGEYWTSQQASVAESLSANFPREPLQANRFVKFFRYKECYNRTEHRITFLIEPAAQAHEIMDMLLSCETSTALLGSAPRGGLEEEVAEYLTWM